MNMPELNAKGKRKQKSAPIDIQANIFEFHTVTQDFSAIGNIRFKKGDVHITGGRVRYDHRAQQVIISQNVHVKKGPLAMYSKEVRADINQNAVQAVGDVKIKYRDYIGTAQKASFNIDQMKVLLKSARVKEGVDLLKADTIIIDIKNNRITSKGNTQVKTVPR